MHSTSFFPTFSALTQYLDGLGMFSMRLGLERMNAALDALKLRSDHAPVVHVVGTNGKGSTAGFLEALARAHGLRTGLYTSPHLVQVRERIRVQGQMLGPEAWLHGANALMAHCADMGLTYFEFITVLAIWLFREHQVELIILEAGLGGTHDATCAIDAQVMAMTPVGMDHEQVLGPGLMDIARDKSGALGRCPAVMGLQTDAVGRLFAEVCAASGHTLTELATYATPQGFVVPCGTAKVECSGTTLPVHPSYQLANAGLAVLAWNEIARHQGWGIEENAVLQTLAGTVFPGRFCQHEQFFVDGAHNTMGLEALCAALEHRGRHFDLLIFQSMADKHLDPAVLDRVQALCDRVCVPGLPGNARASAPHAVAQYFSCPVQTVDSLEEALALCQDRSVLVCGSLYLVGAFYAARPEYFPLS
ncbi:hypothetical protein MASR1M90_14430 [Desulfovibrionales bacterium]